MHFIVAFSSIRHIVLVSPLCQLPLSAWFPSFPTSSASLQVSSFLLVFLSLLISLKITISHFIRLLANVMILSLQMNKIWHISHAPSPFMLRDIKLACEKYNTHGSANISGILSQCFGNVCPTYMHVWTVWRFCLVFREASVLRSAVAVQVHSLYSQRYKRQASLSNTLTFTCMTWYTCTCTPRP